VANPHSRIDDVPLTAGTPDLEEDPVAAYTTIEALRNSRIELDFGVHFFGVFCIWLVTWVSHILLCSHFSVLMDNCKP
jgi:hypothetical protein